jgi:hypothetical protein
MLKPVLPSNEPEIMQRALYAKPRRPAKKLKITISHQENFGSSTVILLEAVIHPFHFYLTKKK